VIPVDRWVEPFAGMLAVALWLRGRVDPPLAYMGSKRGYRDAILAGLDLHPGAGCGELWVADADPHVAAFWRALAASEVPDLSGYEAIRREQGPRAAFTAGREAGDVAGWTVAAALAFRKGDPGSGYSAGTHDAIDLVTKRQPAVAAASRVVRGARVYDSAEAVPVEVVGRTVVLLDPPYAGTTGYAAGCSREAVAALARRWADAGAEVLITERERVVPEWQRVAVHATGKAARGAWEWVTVSPSVRWRGEQGTLWAMPERAPDGSAMTGGVGRG